jgi:hypothetical protein
MAKKSILTKRTGKVIEKKGSGKEIDPEKAEAARTQADIRLGWTRAMGRANQLRKQTAARLVVRCCIPR